MFCQAIPHRVLVFVVLAMTFVLKASPQDLVINEIMYNPPGGAAEEEYIELLNPGPAAVSLTGWEISDGVDFAFPPMLLGAGEYLVVAANLTSFTAKYPTVTNVVGGWNGRLTNRGEAIGLRNAANTLIDRVEYSDEGDWAVREEGPLDRGHRGWVWRNDHDGGGRSLELISAAMPNEYGQNWAAALVGGGTPGRPNSVLQAEIAPMIVDVNRWPVLPTSADITTMTAHILDETPGAVTVTLHHRVDGSPAFTATPMSDDGLHFDGLSGDGVYGAAMPAEPDGTVVEYYIEARDASSSRTLPAPSLVGGSPQQATNFLYLVDDSSGTSVVLRAGSVWRYLDDGSSQGTAWTAPLFDDSGWSSGPAQLGYGDGDENTVVYYGPDINNKYITTYFRTTFEIPDLSAVTGLTYRLVRDDGAVVYLNGNRAFSDNMTTGPVDYQTRALQTTGGAEEAQFFVHPGNPAHLVSGTNVVAVEVHQILPNSTDLSFDLEIAVSTAPGGPRWRPGDEPLYHIIMTEAERAELEDIGLGGGDQDSDAQMNATFISADEEGTKARYNVGVRNRGHGSRDDPPNNYRVNFRHDRTWNDVSAINLNTKYTYLQLVGNRLFQLAGLESPEVAAVQVRVNGRNLAVTNDEMFGSYLRLEVIDRDFAENHFPGDGGGNAYKCMRIVAPGANLRYQGPDPGPYRVNYFKHSNETEDDWSDLIDLTYALSNNTPDSLYVSEVNRVADIDQWLRFLAINTILDNAETTLANGNGDDYYMYRGEQDPRFVLIQHDLDSIFALGDSIGDPLSGIFQATTIPALDRLLNHPEFLPRYYWHLNDLLRTVFAPGRFEPWLDAQLSGWVPQPTIDTMKGFIDTRTAHILSLIPMNLTIHTDLPVVNGYPRTTTNRVALYGTAPAAGTRSIMVNGEPADWSPIDGTWSIGLGGGSGGGETLVPAGSVWRYLDNGSDQGTAWTLPTFNDSAWSSGPAQLGYGGNGEVTPVGYGPDANNKYVTTWFRHEFNVTSASAFTDLTARVVRDDGAVIHLNGQPGPRSNMRLGPVDYLTTAATTVSGGDETAFFSHPADPGMLVEGRNVVAVEIHQINRQSSDLSFDLELTGTRSASGPTTGVVVPPGINRVWVRAFDGPDGTGRETANGYIDVWYDDGSPLTDVSTPLTTDTILAESGGPYRVPGDLIVPVGVTLTIEPGTALYFEAGTQMIVYGRLLCEGTNADRIRLTCNPNTSGDWEGVVFNGTHEDNRITYTAMDFADGGPEAILVRNAQLLLDNMTWTDTNQTVLELDNSNVLARHCVFPSVDNNETVHGHDIPPNGYLIFDGNVFGRTTGYSDIIDFTRCKRPNPILQILNNVFLAGSDDGLDLDGTDAHIEGNIFMNFAQDAPRDSSANAIATGVDGGVPAELTIVRNIFINNEHDILLKEGSSATIQNNTFYGARIASINFDETNRPVTPGYGAYIEGCIFRDMAALFQNQFSQGGESDPIITVNHSVVPSSFHSLGFGNLDADPLFGAPGFHDFTLMTGSPAIGAGPNGLDMGALVPAGASVSGEPPRFTAQRTATLTVAGPGITHYRFSLDGGPYGAEAPVSAPIQLSGLSDGDHIVHLIGKNSAAVWQPESEATASRVWTINGVTDTLTVSEVMYNPPAGGEYEFLELHNTHSTVSLNLAGMVFTNGIVYAFPAGAGILPGGHVLVVRANSYGDFADFRRHYGLDESVAIYGPYDGGLSSTGERVTLEDGLGVELTSFQYDNSRGWPVAADGAGHSLVPLNEQVQPVASLDYGGNWRDSTLLGGSPGEADPAYVPGVVLNELMANTILVDPRYPDHDSNDWIELYNMTASEVRFTDWYLSDDARALKKWAIPSTATLPAAGYLSFDEIGGFHNPISSGFGINQTGERLFLSHLPGTADDRVVDAVRFKGQESGVSLGRFPDGDTYWYAMSPTRDLANTTPHDRVVISEIMFHPSDDSNVNEYVELYNPTSSTVELWNATGPWRLDGGVDLPFPVSMTIGPGGHLLLVNFNPNDLGLMNAFMSFYGLATIDVPVIGPFNGNLSNKGERVAAERPLPPDLPGDLPAWVIVDEAIYFDRAPWTDQADGSGLALQRVSAEISGNDPANWIAGPASPGGGITTQTYTLVVSAVNGVVHKWPDQSHYFPGAQVALLASPAAGYHFAGWTGDVPIGHGGDNPLTITMDSAKNLTANFAINQYTLVASAVNGSVQRSPDSPLYDHGTLVSLTAVPRAGYHFVAWSGNVPPGSETNNPLTVVMDGAKSLAANFVAPTFQVTWPTSGSLWRIGESGDVSFVATNLPGPGEVYVEIWADPVTKAGSMGRVPCHEGPNTIRTVLPPNLPPGTYQLRLFWAEYVGINVWSEPFAARAKPSLQVTWPGADSVWSPGTWRQIEFVARDLDSPGAVFVELWQGSTKIGPMGQVPCQEGMNRADRRLPPALTPGEYQIRLFLAADTRINVWSEWFTVRPETSTRRWQAYP